MPRFCFSPRSIASCIEICKVPATGFTGTLPEKDPCGGGALVDGPCARTGTDASAETTVSAKDRALPRVMNSLLRVNASAFRCFWDPTDTSNSQKKSNTAPGSQCSLAGALLSAAGEAWADKIPHGFGGLSQRRIRIHRP